MDPQFQSELTAAILTLTPGIVLLALVAVLGLLMLLEKAGILASLSGTRSHPATTTATTTATTQAATPEAPTATPAEPAADPTTKTP